jgi:hypothetical protein
MKCVNFPPVERTGAVCQRLFWIHPSFVRIHASFLLSFPKLACYCWCLWTTSNLLFFLVYLYFESFDMFVQKMIAIVELLPAPIVFWTTSRVDQLVRECLLYARNISRFGYGMKLDKNLSGRKLRKCCASSDWGDRETYYQNLKGVIHTESDWSIYRYFDVIIFWNLLDVTFQAQFWFVSNFLVNFYSRVEMKECVHLSSPRGFQ